MRNGKYGYIESLTKELDTAKALNISVNITFWGVDKASCGWLAKSVTPNCAKIWTRLSATRISATG